MNNVRTHEIIVFYLYKLCNFWKMTNYCFYLACMLASQCKQQ